MYTKFIFVAFLAYIASSYALSQSVEERIKCLHQSREAQGRLGESIIKDALEKVRELLKNGVAGLPPLDPLDINNRRVTVNNKLVNLDANLTAKSTGIAGFKLTQISLSVIGLKLKFTITWPKVVANGEYGLDLSSPLVQQKVFGKGVFDVDAEDFTVKGEGKLSLKTINGKLTPQIKSLKVDSSLKQISVAVTGLMNDEELSSQISSKLTNELPQLIQQNSDRINEIIAKVLPYINDFLARSGKTFAIHC